MQLIPIGKIGGAWGLKGECKVFLYNPDSQLLLKTTTLYISEKPVQVLSARRHSQSVVVHFEGVTSPESAKKFQGQEVSVPLSALPKKKEGELYLFELVGMQVVRSTGEPLGLVEEVMHYGASDLLSVGKHLIPYIPDFVLSVSEKDRKIIVEWEDV